MNLDDLSAAAVEFAAAVALAPTEAHPYLALSDALVRAGETAGAIEWLEKGLRNGCKKSAEIHARLGSALQTTSEFAAAEARLLAALEAGHPHPEHVRGLLMQVQIHVKRTPEQ